MADSLYDDFNLFRTTIVRAAGTAWNNERFKNEFIESPLSAMKNEFGYQCPFNVTMRVVRTSAPEDHVFDPVHTGGWVGTNNVLRLYLPPAPTDPKQKPEALAAFNHDHLLLFPRK